jgi:hypothetical protein
MKYSGISKEQGTFGLIFTKKDLSKSFMPFVQFSFINPWLIPKFKKRDNRGSWMLGWGFLYFGVIKIQ